MGNDEKVVRVAKSFRDLNVYRLGLEQAKRIFVISKNFP
jgi:hypothetical protein